MASPASVFCVENGGTLEIVEGDKGQRGMCTLSDGTVCEEWAYFRGECPEPLEDEKKGCLIATATYGSELAPQVQQLRELRDNSLLQTASGTSFMSGFNQFYYSFSPTIADWERESPVFKEAIKLAITP